VMSCENVDNMVMLHGTSLTTGLCRVPMSSGSHDRTTMDYTLEIDDRIIQKIWPSCMVSV
jgi:hypothetical protein